MQIVKKTPLLSLFTFHLVLAILLIDGRAQDPFGDAPPTGDIFGGDTNPNPNAIPTNPTPTTFDNPTTTKPSAAKQLPPTSHPAILAIRERPPSTPQRSQEPFYI